MDYLNFKSWKTSHSMEMQDLTFAKPDDIFIYTRFSLKFPFDCEGENILFAGSIEEVLGYIRHIFIYDILNDSVDDLEYDIKALSDEKQGAVISLLNYWFRLGKAAKYDDKLQILKNLSFEFNREFGRREEAEYEFYILKGANELRDFLIEKHFDEQDFDKKLLANICSEELFAGKLLKDFIDKIFDN